MKKLSIFFWVSLLSVCFIFNSCGNAKSDKKEDKQEHKIIKGEINANLFGVSFNTDRKTAEKILRKSNVSYNVIDKGLYQFEQRFNYWDLEFDLGQIWFEYDDSDKSPVTGIMMQKNFSNKYYSNPLQKAEEFYKMALFSVRRHYGKYETEPGEKRKDQYKGDIKYAYFTNKEIGIDLTIEKRLTEHGRDGFQVILVFYDEEHIL